MEIHSTSESYLIHDAYLCVVFRMIDKVIEYSQNIIGFWFYWNWADIFSTPAITTPLKSKRDTPRNSPTYPPTSATNDKKM